MRNVRMLVALGVLGCVGLLAQAETTPSTKASAKAEALAALKPPPGAKVAIVEFDDLECPYCAHAVPVIEKAAAEYRIPVIHHDYPLTEIHAWSFDAAVTARYLQDSVSPKIADEFRQAVFRNQNAISNKEDLAQFTQRWFLAHHVAEPFVMDASGKCTREVKADRALGDALGNHATTPCIYVVTATSIKKLNDVDGLYAAIDAALAQSGSVGKKPGRM